MNYMNSPIASPHNDGDLCIYLDHTFPWIKDRTSTYEIRVRI